jgi:hypothetical protein
MQKLKHLFCNKKTVLKVDFKYSDIQIQIIMNLRSKINLIVTREKCLLVTVTVVRYLVRHEIKDEIRSKPGSH